MKWCRDEAQYGERRLRLAFHGEDWVAVYRDGLPLDAFPEALGVGDGRGGAWVKLPRSCLDWWRRDVSATWKGVRVGVTGPEREGEVPISYFGDPARAKELGIPGDQNDGWARRVPVVELSEVVEREERVQ